MRAIEAPVKERRKHMLVIGSWDQAILLRDIRDAEIMEEEN